MKTRQWLLFLPLFLALFIKPLAAIQDSRLRKVYTPETPSLLWVHDNAWTGCAQRVLAQLHDVASEGLDAEDYWPLLDRLSKLDLSDTLQRQEADEILTVAALDYISDMKGERLNPRRIDRQLYYRQKEIDEVALLKDFMSRDGQSCQWITTLAPNRNDYRELKRLLAEYRTHQANGDWPTMPRNTKLKRGNMGPEVQQLRDLLVIQGFMSPSQGNGDVFDEAVENAVIAYQQSHGLEDDGEVGPATAKSMSTPIEERIKRVIVAMERHRWLPEYLGDRYVQVNIAGFELKAVENDQVQFTIPIITGRHYRETPNYSTTMTGIRFNPSWHVPYNIAVQDKLPKLQNNSYAFSGRGYNYYDEYGNWVDPGSIDWNSYDRGYFPFTIRQSPGAGNALGKIRFTLANKEHGLAIFLHGTPSKRLWEKAKRSFSSGCIRVKYPPQLAEFAFNSPDWTLDRINREASGYSTKNVPLDEPLNTHITYFTIWVDEDGQTHFVDDVYGQDRQIWDALQAHKRHYRF